MPLMFVAAMMLAQAPAVAPTQPIIVNQKKKQVCEYIDTSGSRMRQKVCHDVGTPADTGAEAPSTNEGMFHAPPPAPAPGGVGAPPR
jgi:hypothetical protein